MPRHPEARRLPFRHPIQEVSPWPERTRASSSPPIDSLLGKVDSKYQLVIFASKRARQINDYYSDLHEGNLFDNVGPLVDSTVEDKPLTIAMHEIHEDKLRLRRAE
ncbi:hypothetical protein GCM10025760_33790 [Microbacterium yannicii]|uniref:DNA-directed RNA polymerase subunit omega n=1 Tax=Microbacterium yannicii TaxID=671622 RepID=A0ABP9MPU4_9MICO